MVPDASRAQELTTDDDSGSSLFGSPRNAGAIDDEFIQNQLQSLQILQARALSRLKVTDRLSDSISEAPKEQQPDTVIDFYGGDITQNASAFFAESVGSDVLGLCNTKGFLAHTENKWLAATSGADPKERRICIAASETWFAIGSSTGRVLVFSRSSSALALELQAPGSSLSTKCAGCVTSMDICSSESVLVAGHESGVVSVWELTKGALLRELSDADACPVVAVSSATRSPAASCLMAALRCGVAAAPSASAAALCDALWANHGG